MIGCLQTENADSVTCTKSIYRRTKEYCFKNLPANHLVLITITISCIAYSHLPEGSSLKVPTILIGCFIQYVINEKEHSGGKSGIGFIGFNFGSISVNQQNCCTGSCVCSTGPCACHTSQTSTSWKTSCRAKPIAAPEVNERERRERDEQADTFELRVASKEPFSENHFLPIEDDIGSDERRSPTELKPIDQLTGQHTDIEMKGNAVFSRSSGESKKAPVKPRLCFPIAKAAVDPSIAPMDIHERNNIISANGLVMTPCLQEQLFPMQMPAELQNLPISLRKTHPESVKLISLIDDGSVESFPAAALYKSETECAIDGQTAVGTKLEERELYTRMKVRTTKEKEAVFGQDEKTTRHDCSDRRILPELCHDQDSPVGKRLGCPIIIPHLAINYYLIPVSQDNQLNHTTTMVQIRMKRSLIFFTVHEENESMWTYVRRNNAKTDMQDNIELLYEYIRKLSGRPYQYSTEIEKTRIVLKDRTLLFKNLEAMAYEDNDNSFATKDYDGQADSLYVICQYPKMLRSIPGIKEAKFVPPEAITDRQGNHRYLDDTLVDVLEKGKSVYQKYFCRNQSHEMNKIGKLFRMAKDILSKSVVFVVNTLNGYLSKPVNQDERRLTHIEDNPKNALENISKRYMQEELNTLTNGKVEWFTHSHEDAIGTHRKDIDEHTVKTFLTQLCELLRNSNKENVESVRTTLETIFDDTKSQNRDSSFFDSDVGDYQKTDDEQLSDQAGTSSEIDAQRVYYTGSNRNNGRMQDSESSIVTVSKTSHDYVSACIDINQVHYNETTRSELTNYSDASLTREELNNAENQQNIVMPTYLAFIKVPLIGGLIKSILVNWDDFVPTIRTSSPAEDWDKISAKLAEYQFKLSIEIAREKRTKTKAPRMHVCDPGIFEDAIREAGITPQRIPSTDEDLLRYELHFPSGCRMVVSIPMNTSQKKEDKIKPDE